MANISTNTLLGSMEWAKKLNFNRQSAIGNFLEPAKTSASIIKQTILSPPFSWWWNTQTITFVTNPNTTPATVTNTALTSNVATYTTSAAHNFNAGQIVSVSGTTNGSGVFNIIEQIITSVPTSTTFTTAITHANVASAADTGTVVVSPQDYAVNAPNFRYIEHSNVQDPVTGKQFEMETKLELAIDSAAARPLFVSPHVQDPTTGNIIFRVMPVPDQAYNVNLHVQQAASSFASVNDTWAPIPDYMEYIYNWGFLSLMWMFADDPRFATANQKFVAHLLGAAQGLTETERNIFLNEWNALTSGQVIAQQQGFSGRAT